VILVGGAHPTRSTGWKACATGGKEQAWFLKPGFFIDRGRRFVLLCE
jgi:hypothetical protein